MHKINNGQSKGVVTLIKWIQRTDEIILDFLNRNTNQQNLRSVMKFISHPKFMREILLVLVLTVLIFGSGQIRWQLLYISLAILLSDQTCNLLKAWTKRIRPDGKRNTNGSFWKKLGHYSFPSSHSANTFTTAVLLANWWPYLALPVFFIAILVSFSRIYLNNHYPSDVVAGGLIGITYGCLVFRIFS